METKKSSLPPAQRKERMRIHTVSMIINISISICIYIYRDNGSYQSSLFRFSHSARHRLIFFFFFLSFPSFPFRQIAVPPHLAYLVGIHAPLFHHCKPHGSLRCSRHSWPHSTQQDRPTKGLSPLSLWIRCNSTDFFVICLTVLFLIDGCYFNLS